VGAPLILAVTHPEDVHAAPVMEAVSRLGGRCLMLDLATLPCQAQVTFSAGRPGRGARLAFADGASVEGAEVGAVWWRRPRPYVPDAGLSPPVAAYAATQVHTALSGVWGSLGAGWMNDPWRNERAGHKPAQLAAAEAAGLAVPPTLITSAPAEARAFLEELGERPVIQKPLQPTEGSWRPTRLVSEADRRRLDDLRLAPAILQAYVPGTDIRVTAAGGRLFATAIDARRTASPEDFRPAYAQARVEPCTLPADVAAGVRALLQDLGLRYAALDFRRTEDGQHLFLEANPTGQWLFLEERTGQPITRAVAEALVEAALESRTGAPAQRRSCQAVPEAARRLP
jgi:glutathione synthase/RimK-type ligase-like ATP-grasp enzyme